VTGRFAGLAALHVLVVLSLVACHTRRPSTPNVLFLLIDSLRSDHLGFAGYNRNTSPCLDSLAARGAAFTTCTAQAPYTIASVPSMLTGLYPSSACYDAEVRVKGLDVTVPSYRLGAEVRSIAALLGNRGYATGAFVANGDVAVRTFGLAEQFQHVDARHLCDSGECAEKLNRGVVEWLQGLGRQPWFCYVHYMDVHYPYNAPPEWASRFSPGYDSLPVPTIQWMRRHGRQARPDAEELAHIEGMYDAEIAYVDNRIYALLHRLETLALAGDLLLVVASDHGEELYEHGGFGHTRTLFEELVRCPLVIVWQGHIPAGVRVRTPVENVDIVPTILDLIRAEPAGRIEGASLVPFFSGVDRRRAVFSEKRGSSLRRGPWKLWEDPEGCLHLFRLDEDPAELVNLSASQPETLRSLQDHLARWRRSLHPPAPCVLEVETLDEDKLAMLRELGYIE
jgi:arylsulfatase A-like enzyme